MTRKHWVRRLPWQFATAGAMAGAVIGISALYSASPAFADCTHKTIKCDTSAGQTSTGKPAIGSSTSGSSTTSQNQVWQFGQNQSPSQQPAPQSFQLKGRDQNTDSQSNQQLNLPKWQGNNTPSQPTANPQPAPSFGQGVEQLVQQWQGQWQQPPAQPQTPPSPPKVTKPAYVAPVIPPVVAPQIVVPSVVPQVVLPKVIDPPPAPTPVFNLLQNMTQRHKPPTDAVNITTFVQPPADPAPVVQQTFVAPPKPLRPLTNLFNPPVQPVIPDVTGAVQQAAAAQSFVGNAAIGPNATNNFDPWRWFNHHPRPHNPVPPPQPPPPPPPPVVYQPQVFHRTVVSCGSTLYYNQSYLTNNGYPYNNVSYPYGNNGYPYGSLGMPYGYNPYLYNQPIAPYYGSVYGQSYSNYPLNSFPNGYNGYQNYNERVYTPYGIEIIHHVFVACPQPVQQIIVVQAPVVPTILSPSYNYQSVSAVTATAPALQPQFYPPAYQQQSGGYIFPPRTGEAGLLGQDSGTTAWLPGFVLIGLLSLFSAGVMARVRQR